MGSLDYLDYFPTFSFFFLGGERGSPSFPLPVEIKLLFVLLCSAGKVSSYIYFDYPCLVRETIIVLGQKITKSLNFCGRSFFFQLVCAY